MGATKEFHRAQSRVFPSLLPSHAKLIITCYFLKTERPLTASVLGCFAPCWSRAWPTGGDPQAGGWSLQGPSPALGFTSRDLGLPFHSFLFSSPPPPKKIMCQIYIVYIFRLGINKDMEDWMRYGLQSYRKGKRKEERGG